MINVPGARAVAAAHAAVIRLRNRLYDTNRLESLSLPRLVISVGNVTLGGTGKTPFVESLARLLSAEGYVVCILSRGYRAARHVEPLLVSDLHRLHAGPSQAGDEPFLLARRLPGVPVVVGRNRHEAGLFALERLPVNVFVLDDGFQHRALHRDIDIVLVDSTNPWGGGHLLPAGTLREPKHGIARAHAIGLTRMHQCAPEAGQALQAELQQLAPGVPVFGTRSRATGLSRVGSREIGSLKALEGQPVFAFAGIARPGSFFADVEALGAHVVGRRAFRDHHPFTRQDLRELLEAAASAGASMLVTTEKDAMRLPAPPRGAPGIVALRHCVEPQDPAGLLRFLASKLPGASR